MPGTTALASLAMGGLLLVAAIAEIWLGAKAEDVADRARPEMTDAGLAQHRSDFETAREALAGFRRDVLPALARSLGTTPEQLESALTRDYPASAELVAQQNAVGTFAETGLVNLERQQANFQEADSLPVPGLPGYAGGLVNLALAVTVLVSAAFMRRQSTNTVKTWPFVAIASVAALMLIVPLALRMPQKAQSAQELLDSLNPSGDVIVQTGAHFDTTRAGVAELETDLIPGLAAALGLSRSQFDAALAQQFPEVSRGLAGMPEIVDRYEVRFDIRKDVAADLRTLKRIPLGTLGWFDPVFGVALGGVAALSATAARRQPPMEARRIVAV